MKWVITLAWLFHIFAATVGATPAPLIDESKPELVKRYILVPCEALEDSFVFQRNELEIITNRLKHCYTAAENNPEYEHAKLMCLYVNMQWQFMYDHIKSVEKAYELMCEDGVRKNPEYEIDF